MIQELPEGKLKIDLFITEGSHSIGDEITKQIYNREWIGAALENPNLKFTIDELLSDI